MVTVGEPDFERKSWELVISNKFYRQYELGQRLNRVISEGQSSNYCSMKDLQHHHIPASSFLLGDLGTYLSSATVSFLRDRAFCFCPASWILGQTFWWHGRNPSIFLMHIHPLEDCCSYRKLSAIRFDTRGLTCTGPGHGQTHNAEAYS